MSDSELRERLAELEHEQWAHWTSHMLEVLLPPFRLLTSPMFNQMAILVCGEEPLQKALEAVTRWQRQCLTPYSELTEKEKDSDREWADKVLKVCHSADREGWLIREWAVWNGCTVEQATRLLVLVQAEDERVWALMEGA